MAKRANRVARISRGRVSNYRQLLPTAVTVKVRDTKKLPKTMDSFANFGAQLGVGTDNLLSQGTYIVNPITRNRMLLDYCYRGSWICKAVIEAVADDMTREGVEILSDLKPDDIDELVGEIDDLKIMTAFNELTKWGRLYGGAIGVHLVDGQDFSTPLRIDAIGLDQYKGICVMDRWMINPDWSEPITDMGPNLGRPSFYEPVPGLVGYPAGRIHYSRCIRYDGVAIPYYQRLTENGWGLSVLEPMWDRLLAFDSATLGTAQMVFKAHIRTMKMKGLRTAIAGPASQLAALVKNIEFVRKYQSLEGLTVIDGEDEFETNDYTFSGLAEVIDRLASQMGGAVEIPLIRLMGEAPTGLSSDGSGVIRTYYDKVTSEQKTRLKDGMTVTLDCVHRSVFGKAPDSSFKFKFPTLWQLDEKEKAEVAGAIATAVKAVFDSGIINQPTALKELAESSEITGVFTNVTAQVIKDAENNPPAPAGLTGLPPAVLTAQARIQAAEKKPGEEDPGGAEPDPKALAPPKIPSGDEDPNHKPAGPGGGQFATTGGVGGGGGGSGGSKGAAEQPEDKKEGADPKGSASDPGYEFVSPNVHNLDFPAATKELNSARQKALLHVSSVIDSALGETTKNHSIIGAWADGAENSVMTVVDHANWDKLKLAGAMKGYLADQKAVLVFQQKDGGDSALYKFQAKGDLKAIHDGLLADGVAFHTLVPDDNGDGATIYVADMDGSAHDAVAKAAERYDAQVEYHRGRAEFVGTSKEDGTDREQRDDARRAYEKAIGESPVQGGSEIWSRIHSRVGEKLGLDKPGGDAKGAQT